MQARYVILRVLLENTPPGCVTVQVTTGADGKPDLLVELDQTLIATTGKEAIRDFLDKLQVLYNIMCTCSNPSFIQICNTIFVWRYPLCDTPIPIVA